MKIAYATPQDQSVVKTEGEIKRVLSVEGNAPRKRHKLCEAQRYTANGFDIGEKPPQSSEVKEREREGEVTESRRSVEKEKGKFSRQTSLKS